VKDTAAHSYAVKAYDAAGNRSNGSNAVSATLGSTSRK
jgi:hypothetical protein